MLRYRLLSAVVGVPLLLVLTWLGGLWFTGFVVLLALVGFQEYYAALRHRGVEVVREVGFPAVVAVIAGTYFLAGEELLLFLQGVLVVTVIASLAFHIFVTVEGSKLASAAATVMGVVYVGFLFSFLVLVREMPGVGAPTVLPFGLRLFVVVLFATWGADTGAYAVGKALGKRKLCPQVSPGKTVEGAFGGFLFATLASSWLGWWAGFLPEHALALGVLAATLGLLGDLSNSVIKRDVGIKDFGTLIPGHGGVLDRFDSLLINMPAAYFFAIAFMQ